MQKNRRETWIALGVLAVGLPIAVLVGVLMYYRTTAAVLHPNPDEVKSVLQAPPSPRWTTAVEEARKAARAGLSEQNLPGISVAVAVGQDLIWAEGFGWANIEDRVPVTPKTRFRMGHVSKVFTSAAVGLLRDQGRLQLDEEIQTYVPAFPRKQGPVTLRQLMGHTAGIRHYTGEEADVPSSHCERASEGLSSFAAEPLLFEPDTASRYSTYGWVLVSAAVEAVAKEPFFAFMRAQIFAPLGMTDTMPDSATDTIQDRATFYFPRFSGENTAGLLVARAADYSCFAGAGAFLSTPTDLVRFGIALGGDLRQGSGAQGAKFLEPATVRMLQTPQVLASGKETEFGLGWTIESYTLAGRPTTLVSDASRALLGASVSFLAFPHRGIIVVVTSNTSYAGTRSIALRIAEAFAGSNLSHMK